jgi:hypothetical protein
VISGQKGFWVIASVICCTLSTIACEQRESAAPQASESPELTFSADLGAGPGEYTLNGELVSAFVGVVDSRTTVSVPQLSARFRFSNDGFVREDASSGNLPPPADFPAIHWASAIEYDPTTRSLIGISTGGAGQAIAYLFNPFEARWIASGEIGERSFDPVAIEFDDKEKWLVVLSMGKRALKIDRLTSDLHFSEIGQVEYDALEGFFELYDEENEAPPAIDILKASDRYLVLATEASDAIHTNLPRVPKPPTRVYLYDTQSRSAVLTFQREEPAVR